MTAINNKYIPFNTLQAQFWDGFNNIPLSGGIITFYYDNQRTIKKPIYQIANGPDDYEFIEISNPIKLSPGGVCYDESGNNVIPYLYPYDSSGNTKEDNIELYYVTIYGEDRQFILSQPAVPYLPIQNSDEDNMPANMIINGQFENQYTWSSSGAITSLDTEIAYGGWHYTRSNNDDIDYVKFTNLGIINSPTNNPTGNPRWACNITSTSSFSVNNLYKRLEKRFKDVNNLSDPNQYFSMFFSAISNNFAEQIINVYLYKYFGSPNGTLVNPILINTTPIKIAPTWTNIPLSFIFGSNYGNVLGINNDDYFAIRIELPVNSSFNLSFTDFYLAVGDLNITKYPFALDQIEPYSVNSSLVEDPTLPVTVPPTQGSLSSVLKNLFAAANKPFSAIKIKTFTENATYYPSSNVIYCLIEVWGAGGAGGGCVATSNTRPRACGGGGAGGYGAKIFSIQEIGSSLNINIGVGGSATLGGSGNPGGPTYIGNDYNSSVLKANGGKGAIFSSGSDTDFVTAGASGGDIGVGDIVTKGNNGFAGVVSTANNGSLGTFIFKPISGAGGGSTVGSGGISAVFGFSLTNNGYPGSGFASGGSGAILNGSTTISTRGGPGANGIVIITEFCSVQEEDNTIYYIIDNDNNYLIDDDNNYITT